MLLIGRTPAACRRSANHCGDVPSVTSATAPAYRGHSPGSSSEISRRSLRPVGSDASRTFAVFSGDGRMRGSANAVDTSRARPRTLRQSGRFAVISKSITASPPARCSIDATSKPRSPSVAAISSADAVMLTNSRSHETTSRIEPLPPIPFTKTRSHETTKDVVIKECSWFRALRGFVQQTVVRARSGIVRETLDRFRKTA